MITGSSFILRTVKERDLDRLVDLLGDIDGQGDFLPIELVSESRLREEYRQTGLWTETFQRLVMVDEADRILGTLWVFRAVPYFDALELGYKLFDRETWGKGLTSEAVGLLVDHLFSARQVNRLEIRCDLANEASAKVARKNGFAHEGVSRQAAYARGRHRDMHLFALLRSDWQAARAAA